MKFRNILSQRANHKRLPPRRGAALVLAVMLMFALLSFLAFSVDTGYLAQTRAEMRRTADAAAMAGCWEWYTQLEQRVDVSNTKIRQASASMAALNPVCRSSPTLDVSSPQDVQIGYVGDTRNGSISSNSSLPYLAVKTKVSRTVSKNGEVPFFFGKIFGDAGIPMESEATAVMGQYIGGFSTPATPTDCIQILPFALDLETWEKFCDGETGDRYSVDPTNGNICKTPDGVCEINLYPQGTGSPGNRGTVDIGGSNNSTRDIERQIMGGILPADLKQLEEDTGATLDLCKPTSCKLNGDTGISAGVKDELANIICQKRIIPVFSEVVMNGNTATYTICKWVGVRIMAVKLTGSMSSKYLYVQPCHVVCDHAVVATEGTEWSAFVLSPVLLAR